MNYICPRHDLNRWCCLWQKLQLLYCIANEHRSYNLKCIECLHGLDMITPWNSIHFLGSGAHAICYVWFVGSEEYPMKGRSVLKMLGNVDQVLAMMVRKFENCLLDSIAWLEELMEKDLLLLPSFFYLWIWFAFSALLPTLWQSSCFLKWCCKVADIVFRNKNGIKSTLKPLWFLFHTFVTTLLY